MEEIGFIYITCGSLKEAQSIAKNLTEKKLAACANILPNMQSCYEDDSGNIDFHDEAVLLLKTRKSLFEIIRKEMKHSYTCPCFVYIPFEKANSSFKSWILSQTKK